MQLAEDVTLQNMILASQGLDLRRFFESQYNNIARVAPELTEGFIYKCW
jgi:hypothetical protein